MSDSEPEVYEFTVSRTVRIDKANVENLVLYEVRDFVQIAYSLANGAQEHETCTSAPLSKVGCIRYLLDMYPGLNPATLVGYLGTFWYDWHSFVSKVACRDTACRVWGYSAPDHPDMYSMTAEFNFFYGEYPGGTGAVIGVSPGLMRAEDGRMITCKLTAPSNERKFAASLATAKAKVSRLLVRHILRKASEVEIS